MQILIIFVASILIWVMFLVVPWLWWKGLKQTAGHIFLASTVAWFLSQTIKYLFYIPRPYIAGHLEAIVLRAPTDGTFPSSHAAAAFALATVVWLYRKDWGLVAILLATAIGVARVLSHVHYPIDIVGGAILGIGVALTTQRLSKETVARILIKEKGNSK